MPPAVSELIQGRSLISVYPTTLVRTAILFLVEHNYKQLPVIDEHGHALGLFTEHRLTQELCIGTATHVLDLPVSQFMETPVPVVNGDDSIYDVAKLLGDSYAVVVAEQGQAIGIITDYDIAAFLVSWSEGLALVEDIEKRLRTHIEHVFVTPEAMQAALFRTFGVDRRDPSKPMKVYAELTIADHARVILTEEHWPRFEATFQSRDLLYRYLEAARRIRNQIAHFRGKLTREQVVTLKNVQRWLERIPPPRATEAVSIHNVSSDDTQETR